MRQVTMATTALALSFVMCAAYVAFADAPRTHERVVFATVDDLAAAVRVEKSAGELPSVAVDAAQEPSDAPGEPDEGEAYYADYSASYAPRDNGDGFMQQGVREYEGRAETWYSSNVARHEDTDQWTTDEEGYYRDPDGNYVVAASDKEQGTTFETSKGTAKVYDSGCQDGVTDFYTAF